MINIAVCDDDMEERSNIMALLSEYQINRGLKITCYPFSDGLSMIESMRTQPYNIVILDILMPGFTGIDTAREIRNFDELVKLVFLSNSPEFAVESYSVDAYYYLLKPANKDLLFSLMDRMVASVADQNRDGLVIRRRSGIFCIPYAGLEVVEIVKKTISFCMSDGNTHDVYGALRVVENDLLVRPEFVKTHRSYLVNLRHIHVLHKNELQTYSGRTIPISKALYNEVREAYMKYLFTEKKEAACNSRLN